MTEAGSPWTTLVMASPRSCKNFSRTTARTRMSRKHQSTPRAVIDVHVRQTSSIRRGSKQVARWHAQLLAVTSVLALRRACKHQSARASRLLGSRRAHVDVHFGNSIPRGLGCLAGGLSDEVLLFPAPRLRRSTLRVTRERLLRCARSFRNQVVATCAHWSRNPSVRRETTALHAPHLPRLLGLRTQHSGRHFSLTQSSRTLLPLSLQN
jgi:hypothetical protein